MKKLNAWAMIPTKRREKSLRFFGGPGASVPGQNFHYTMAPAICQEEMLHKKQKIKIPQFVHFAYCNLLLDVL